MSLDVRWFGLGVQGERAEAVEQRVDGDARLHAGQVHAEADVDAEAEADVLALARGTCRSGRGRRTCARHGWRRRSSARRRAPSSMATPASSVFARGAAQDHGDGRLPAHHLLEGLGEQGAVGVERVELGPVVEQREEQAARWPGRSSRRRPGSSRRRKE